MEALRFQILGPVRGQCGGRELGLGSPQQQAILAALLLLGPGRSAGAEELIEALWGERPPTRGKAVLRTYVWRLRQALAEAGAAGDAVLVSLAGGYRLVVGEGALDADAAEGLARGAERAQAAGQAEEARELLRQALDLWRGEPLAAVPGPFAERQRQRFTELRLSLLERRIGLDVRLGRPDRCIPELRTLTAEHPLRESLYGLLMRAFTGAGRRADALAVYRAARRRLIDELGVEPGAELAAVHAAVLDGRLDDGLHERGRERGHRSGGATTGMASRARGGAEAGDPGRAPGRGHERSDERGDRPGHARESVPAAEATAPGGPPAPEPTPTTGQVYAPAQLPPREPDFVGRDALVTRLREALARPPHSAPAVLALAGMGGVGKTALALHVAHQARPEFPDGQLYVNLRGDTATPADPEGVLAEFLGALGVAPDRLPEGRTGRTALFRSVTDGRRLLIVLDNAADAKQVRPLLPGTGSCATMVTSRKRLVGLPATLQLDLGVFAPEEARQLLALVVGAERVAAEADAAKELLRATGWLPLAVRIVAARLDSRPGWTLRAMGDRLADERRRIDELRIGEVAVAAAFELGYRQLADDQAEAFRLLGAVDATELGLRSAAALLGREEAEAERLLESLVDVAMLESPADGRYRHHDLLRDFARHVSARTAPGEEIAARDRLLDFLLAAVCAAFEQAVPGDPIRGMLDPRPHSGIAFTDRNAGRTWAVAEAPGAVELAARIAQEAGGDGASARAHQAMLPRAVNLLVALSPFGQGASRGRLGQALDAMARVGAAQQDLRSEGRSCFLAGNIALGAGRYDLAEQRTLRAVELCQAADDPAILRQALNVLGVIAHATGRYTEAVAHFTDAVALARGLGHRSGETASALNAAAAQIRIGQSAAVVTQCQDLLEQLRLDGDRLGGAHSQFVLGLALHAEGRGLDAAERFEAAAGEWADLGAPGRAAHARLKLAQTLLETGDPVRARSQAEAALAEFERSGSTAEQVRARSLLDRALKAEASQVVTEGPRS